MLLIFLVGVGLWLFYKYYTAVFKKWDRRGVFTVPPSFPFGSSIDMSLSRKYMGHAIDDFYYKAAPHPYFAYFNMRSSTLVLRDPEIIRLVMAKEFSHFRDRQPFKVPKGDILGNHLFNLEGERWRGLRIKLSPTFTSGKLKGMFQHFIKCAEGLDNLLLSKAGGPLDVKDVIARFTVDTITSCAFGLEANAIDDDDSQFRKIAVSFFNITAFLKYQLALIRAFPFLLKLNRPRFTSKGVESFLLNMVKDTVEHREKTNLQRNDFIDLLIQLKNKGSVSDDMQPDEGEKPAQPVEMTIELMTSQAFVFFFAGYETSSSVQSFCLYELALHPEIQERLRKEIESTISRHGGLTYQAILDMEYLDMVVSALSRSNLSFSAQEIGHPYSVRDETTLSSLTEQGCLISRALKLRFDLESALRKIKHFISGETMRKYPTLMYLTRCCTKDFITPAGHRIEKGDRILIPVWSLHHDPAYFPDPDKFDPERFSKENKTSIVPYTYLPFGEGPRICIGMRFGLLQTKVGLITFLRKFNLEPSKDTQIPLEFSSNNVILTATKGPINVRMTKREIH